MLGRRNEFKERYDLFYKQLRDEIVSGQLKPGEFILPENTLSEKYNLSRVSIRRVLADLVDEGLIEKIAGKGNRVVIPEEERPVETLHIAWFNGSYEIDIVRNMMRLFEESHPFVRLELTVLPDADYTDAIIRLIDQGQGPDVFMISESHYRVWIESGRTSMLTGYIPPHLNPEHTSYAKVFELFTHENRMLAAPFVFSPVVICYNRTIFRNNGISQPIIKSWDDLLETALRSMGTPNGEGRVEHYGFGFSSSINRWPVFLVQHGGQMMSPDDGRCTFSLPSNVEALEFCVSLMYKHQVSPIFTHGSNHLAENLFVKERVAMIMTTYYFMNEFRDHPIEWDILPATQETLLLGGGLAINSSSPKVELAQKVVDFMTGEQAQKMLKRNGCTIPALRSVAEDVSLYNPAVHPSQYHRFLDALPNAKPLSALGLTQRRIEFLYDELNLLWANMESPEKACKRIEDVMNEKHV
ncbi:extracellular solute-binding protein [Paenibacillus sp. MBLB4367]|uniref:extracellular solute-binding protein n=1 Tax=Paenibacillus sp. MBLB4367 TaxID=3384767 RepID=UPI0039080610